MVPVVIHRAGPGPTVAITANVHGDEVTGVAAAHALDRGLIETGLARGTVVLYPCLNPRGLETGTRRFGDADLNRCFPGSARGGASTRAAHAIWTDLLDREPDAAIDLHADSPAAVPYALVDRAVHRRADRESLEGAAEALARASGFVWMREYIDDDYIRFQLDRSLAGALLNHGGIPSVTLEVGPRRVAQAEAIETMTAAVVAILAHLGLVDGQPAKPAPEGPWRRAATPRAERPGVFVPTLAAGTPFDAGDALGEIRGLDGTCRSVIRGPSRGIVISWAEGAWVDTGTAVGTLALED